MTRLTLILCFLFLSGAKTFAQAEQKDPAVILRQYTAAKGDTDRAVLLLRLAEYYISKTGTDKVDEDSARLLIGQAKDLSVRGHFPRGIAEAGYLLGWSMAETQEYGPLQQLLPTVDDSTRQKIVERVLNYAVSAGIRTRGRFDTATTILAQMLRLNANAAGPTERLALVLQVALVNYCDDSVRSSSIPPDPAWTDTTKMDTGGQWLRNIMNWMRLNLRSPAMLDAFATLQRQVTATWRPDQQRAIADPLREMFLEELAQEAADHLFKRQMVPAENLYVLAIGFNRTSPQINNILYANVGFFYSMLGKYQKALQIELEGVRSLEKEKTLRTDVELPYWIIGNIYLRTNRPEASLENYKKALALIRQQGRPVHTYLIKAMAEAWLDWHKPAEALDFLQKNANPGAMGDHANKQVYDEVYGDCLYALGRYDEAERYYLSSLAEAKKIEPRVVIAVSFPLGRLYIAMGKYDQARDYLLAVEKNAGKGYNSQEQVRLAEQLLYRADSATANYRSAMAHLQQYKNLSDSMNDATKNKQVEELRLQYETEKKDKDIQLLTDRSQLQAAALRQTTFLRNGLIGGSVMLILLLVLLFNRYRLKQRNNRLLTQLNTRQERLLAEKEWLVREIHHRVKNNLQLVISLLNTQAATLKDEMSRNAFDDIRSRIRAISLIHQKLYQEHKDLTLIHIRDYVEELVGFLQDSMAPCSRVRFRFEIDPFDLDVTQCVPVGLVLNEAITNAIKHAFPEGADAPLITITMQDEPGLPVKVVIADNGVGLPAGFERGTSSSMGLQLIHTLAAQLDGSVTIENRSGVVISLCFPPDRRMAY